MYDYVKYLNLFFKKNGRDISGVDCYGLAMMVAKEQAGIDFPEMNNAPVEENLIDEIINENQNKLEEIEKQEQFCLVLFSITPPYKHHVGLVLDDCKRFIHIREGHRAKIDRLDSQLWKPMIKGFYKNAR